MQRSPKRRIVYIAGLICLSLACNLVLPGAKTPSATQPAVQHQATGGPTQVEAKAVAQVRQTLTKELGGKISAQNAQGDIAELTVPPFALAQDTGIAITLLPKPPDSPVPADLFPGVRLEPESLRLRLPARLTVRLANPVPGPAARLFWIKRPDLALPLSASQVQGNALSGQLIHFSAYTGGVSGTEIAQSQATAAGKETGNFPGEWQDRLENDQGLSEWGRVLGDLGLGDTGQEAIDAARDRLNADLACLMDPGCFVVPLDPCGEYLQMLAQYYDQAIRLGIDPGSEAMSFLENELTRVLNECTNRYSLEYNHNLSVNQGSVQQNIQVTGRVIFSVPIYRVTDLGEPLKAEGSGQVNVTITGQIVADDETCTISGSGTTEVKISGPLEADAQGRPQLNLEVNERWYTTGSMTLTCPDDSNSVPLPALPDQTHPLRFPYQDGATYQAQNLGGMQGSYNWTLHILHTW